MAKPVSQILKEAEQLNQESGVDLTEGELDKSTIADVGDEIAYAIEEGGGIEDMDQDDVMEMIGMFLEDTPGAEFADESDMKKIYKYVTNKLG